MKRNKTFFLKFVSLLCVFRQIFFKMPRKYKRKRGTRPYQNYTEDSLQEALLAMEAGITQKDVSKKYGIPVRTLRNKKAKRHMLSCGRGYFASGGNFASFNAYFEIGTRRKSEVRSDYINIYFYTAMLWHTNEYRNLDFHFHFQTVSHTELV